MSSFSLLYGSPSSAKSMAVASRCALAMADGTSVRSSCYTLCSSGSVDLAIDRDLVLLRGAGDDAGADPVAGGV